MMDTVDALMVLLFPFLDTIPFTMPRYWIFAAGCGFPSGMWCWCSLC